MKCEFNIFVNGYTFTTMYKKVITMETMINNNSIFTTMATEQYLYIHALFLQSIYTIPNSAGISMQLEGFGEVSKGQNWGGGAQDLKCIKGFLAFILPLNFSFFMRCIVPRDLVIEGLFNFSVTLDKASIIFCEPQKVPQFCDHGGNAPVFDSSDFLTIGLDTLLQNLVTHINHTVFKELTLSALQH